MSMDSDIGHLLQEGRTRADVRAALTGKYDATKLNRAIHTFAEPALSARHRAWNFVLVSLVAFAGALKAVALVVLTRDLSMPGPFVAAVILLGLAVPGLVGWLVWTRRSYGYVAIILLVALDLGDLISAVVHGEGGIAAYTSLAFGIALVGLSAWLMHAMFPRLPPARPV